jgi:phosphoribosylglycinamide formyltransferase 2
MSFNARILLLGSGELGREFAMSAKRLGAFVIGCDSYADAPAMQVADARRVAGEAAGRIRIVYS